MSIESYHIHTYYDKKTKWVAEKMRERFVELSKLPIIDVDAWNSPESPKWGHYMDIGQMHDELIGPHTKPQFRVAIRKQAFHFIVDAVMLCHHGLSVLIHPETDSEYRDHTGSAMWLGKPVKLDLTRL